jgi:hypothetical protein
MLMLRMYWRASLLLQAVVEREQDIKMRYATEALMQYAVYMAKHNWNHLIKLTASGQQSVHQFEWEIETDKKGDAHVVYKAGAGKDRLAVEVSLQPDAGRLMKVSCELIGAPEGRVATGGWKEG